MDDLELENALRPLTGSGFYRNNVFRLTGLPVDATDRQVRQRREEAELAFGLGTPLPWLSKESTVDSEAVRTAFESVRNPVLRLSHELLWLCQSGDCPDGLGELDAYGPGLRAHRTAFEREYAMASPPRPGGPDSELLDSMWRQGLAAWAAVLRSDELWDWAKRRVRDLDDPRLTTGTVRRLRARLPAHVISAGLSLAVRAAESAESPAAAAQRYVRLLEDSPFDDDLVDQASRDAVRPTEDRLRRDCENTEKALSSDAEDFARIGGALLDRARGQLRVLTVLLGADDPLTAALRDETADLINQCVVAHHNADGESATGASLLRQAREWATDRSLAEVIDRNITMLEKDRYLDLVAPLCEHGKVEQAAARLRAWRKYATEDDQRKVITTLLADGRAVRGPIDSAPTRMWIYVFGLALIGRRSPAPDDTYIATHCLMLLFLPIPLAAYLRDKRFVYAKVPLSDLARWWRRISLLLVAMVAASMLGGVSAGWWTALAGGGLSTGLLLAREYRLRSWVTGTARTEKGQPN